MNKKSLIVFLKSPVPGNVKTRLAKTLGDEFATGFYKINLQYLLKLLHDFTAESQVDVFLYIDTPFIQQNNNIKIPVTMAVKYQSPGDIGERMKNAFREQFLGGYEKVLLIGSDIPDFTVNILSQAFNALDEKKVVFGPSVDGGYYLIGQRRYSPELFNGINWSTSMVLEESLKKLKSNEYDLLEEKIDIDNVESLKEWLSAPGGNRKIKESVARLLSKI